MAIVKIGQIKSTPAKALAYISRPDATQDGLWISTNAAVIDPSDWRAIARQFDATNKTVSVTRARKGSVLAQHVIQSFSPDEAVSAELAHRLGVQLAEQITHGAHEYVVATHLDKGHVHNHIIFNATNMQTGRKFRCQRDTIGHIRDLSDALCRGAGLTVLPSPKRATGRSFGDIYTTLRGQNAKEALRVEIDKAVTQSRTWMEFERTLELAGVETRRRGGTHGTVSFRDESMGRAVRDWRLGEAYTESSIMARLSRSPVQRISVDQSMIVHETRDTMTINVPGTHRQLHMTVAKQQVVRHGRAARIYLPIHERHVLADKRGRLAATVTTQGLYRWFSEPDLDSVAKTMPSKQLDMNQVVTWRDSLNGLRDLQRRVNAKARWMSDGTTSIDTALSQAKKRLDTSEVNFQTRLVAAADLMTNGDQDGQLAVLQAELRLSQREIEQLKTDVSTLTTLNREESKMSVAESIARRLDQSRRNNSREAERAAQRARYADQNNDRETPAHQIEREDENEAQDTRTDGQRHDRDRGTGRDTGQQPSLAERIDAEVGRRRATRDHHDGRNDEEGSRGWNL